MVVYCGPRTAVSPGKARRCEDRFLGTPLGGASMFKKFFVVLVPGLVLAIATSVMAQDKAKGKREGKGGEKAKAQVQVLPKALLEGLELSDEQKVKLEEIAKEMKAPVVEARKAMDSLLTDEQKEARKAAQAKAKEEGKTPREAQKAVDEALKLTPEQQEKMAKAKEKQAEVQKQIRDKVMEILTPEQRTAVEEKMKKSRGAEAKGGKGKKTAAEK